MKLSQTIVDLGDYLLNIRTGEAFEVNDNGRRLLQSLPDIQEEDSPDEFCFMVENGILVSQEVDKKRDRFYLQWHLLNTCNLKCQHCYDWKTPANTLDYFTMLRIIDDYSEFLKQMEFNGELSFTGGEPLLFPRLMDLIRYAKKCDVPINISVLTNGTLLDEELFKEAKEHDVGFQVSIDGDEATHDKIRGKGSYRKAMATLMYLVQEGIKNSVHFVIMRENQHCIDALIEELEAVGVNRLNLSRLVPIGPGATQDSLEPHELRAIYERIVRLNEVCALEVLPTRPLWTLVGSDGVCPVGYNTLTIDANGLFMPCRRIDKSIGNARCDSFFKVWFTDPFLCKMREREKFIEVCGTCDKNETCGGCRAIAKAVTGNLYARDPGCWYHTEKGGKNA